MPRPTTPAQYVLILIDLAEQAGCNRSQLLAGTSLASTGIDNIGARVEDSDFNRLAQNALTLTGNPALGMEMGMRMNLGAHAVLGQAFMTCRNLAEAIDLFLKYHHLLSANLEVGFEDDGRYCYLKVMEGGGHELPRHFGQESFFAAVLNTIRGLLNMPDLQVSLELPYPEPAHAHLYRDVFGEDLQFDAPLGRVIFPSELMQARLPSSNPALRALYEQECARLLADLEEDDSVAQQTLRLLRKLEGQYPQMPTVARMLNLSARTYRRRLQQEQESFQELLDQVRAEHATRYLQNTRLPLSTIAYMIGFNDASNFRRAYQKWTGRSPRETRNDH
ncbi:helix-turn-helix domain-containing protein [Seongchinamella sediminis]|uniref:Helix-turn-helix domain-containing protein n=1 Tax=Seongchinamella sediminis TaxID=2283635 RepID=A0A3L7DTD3_9GAMM|nr:AraC family transcriptional regulator [Seongchinamella sediminis]RLQ20867.1 helix-turn-helix domain-containing protein [Seongchinamella sediminis]